MELNSIEVGARNTSTGNTRLSRLAPIFTLIVFAPGIAELLSGSTRLSFIFVFIPEMMVWGCGALLIREIVRRWHGGWSSVLLLGLGLSIAEEFIIQQTSLAPLPWVSAPAYGRAWGVNWIYFLFMLGYESVWVVLVPVQLTELIFPERRNESWLKTRGLINSSIIFLLGSFFAWFLWTQIARPITLHVPKYQPPFLTILAGGIAIAVLVCTAYAIRGSAVRTLDQQAPGVAPPPWVAGIAALVFGFPWYILMALIFGPRRDIAMWIPLACGIVWAGLANFLFKSWASGNGWRDIHRWALVFCATIVSMVAGFFGSATWSRSDIVAKIVLNLAATAGFIWLAIKIARRRDCVA